MSDRSRLPKGEVERLILDALSRLPGQRGTVGDIVAAIGDDPSRAPAYYPALNRLIREDKVYEIRTGRNRFVALASSLVKALTDTPGQARSDVWARGAPASDRAEEQLRQAAEQAYADWKRQRDRRAALGAAAQFLLAESPVELVMEYLRACVAAYEQAAEAALSAKAADQKRRAEREMERGHREVLEVAHRALGIHKVHLRLTPPTRHPGTNGSPVVPAADWEAVRARVAHVLHGATVIEQIQLDQTERERGKSRLVAAGTDASTHPVWISIPDAPPDEQMPLAINNAAAFFQDLRPPNRKGEDDEAREMLPYDLVAGPDGENVGAIVGPSLYLELEDDKYWRSVACASDTCQYTLEFMILTGRVERLGRRGVRRTPAMVVIRDGRLYPIEHLIASFKLDDRYGDFVRREIAAFRDVVQHVLGANGAQTYCGAVKQSKLRFFSHLVNWYIREGSSMANGGVPIDPDWPRSEYGAPLDTSLVTDLLSTLPTDPEAGVYFRTCGLEREFWVMAGLYETPRDTKYGQGKEPIADFVEYFRARQEEDERDTAGTGGLAIFDPRDYAYLCENGSIVMFFSSLHRPTDDTTYRLPRLEVLVKRRSRGEPSDAEQAMRKVVAVIDVVSITPDDDHDFGSGGHYLVPQPVWEAHETSKNIGDDYASRIEAGVFAMLARLIEGKAQTRQLRLFDFRPGT